VTQDDDWTSLSSVVKASLSVGVCFVLVGTSKRLPTRTTGDVLSGTLCESIGFSPAGCTSIRITATIGYEYLLFVAVIT
jgi:hypothetical protein